MPVHEVMGLAVSGLAVAPGKRALFVAVGESVADRGGGQTVLAADVERHRVAAQHHRDQRGIAGHAAGLSRRQVPTGVQNRGPESVNEVAQCHGEDQVRALPTPGGQPTLVEQAAHGFHEGVGIAARWAAGISLWGSET